MMTEQKREELEAAGLEIADLSADISPQTIEQAEDIIRKQAEKMAKKVKRNPDAKEYPLDRRTVYQTYGHFLAALDRLWSFRDIARKERHLDDVQFATEGIYHIKQAMAYLNILSRHKFGCDTEDLKVYK